MYSAVFSCCSNYTREWDVFIVEAVTLYFVLFLHHGERKSVLSSLDPYSRKWSCLCSSCLWNALCQRIKVITVSLVIEEKDVWGLLIYRQTTITFKTFPATRRLNSFIFSCKFSLMGCFCFAADINDKVTEQLQKLKTEGVLADWRSKVLGGGRIKHEPATKTIQVYGYSQVRYKWNAIELYIREICIGRWDTNGMQLNYIQERSALGLVLPWDREFSLSCLEIRESKLHYSSLEYLRRDRDEISKTLRDFGSRME